VTFGFPADSRGKTKVGAAIEGKDSEKLKSSIEELDQLVLKSMTQSKE
jgi:hypothetical protein